MIVNIPSTSHRDAFYCPSEYIPFFSNIILTELYLLFKDLLSFSIILFFFFFFLLAVSFPHSLFDQRISPFISKHCFFPPSVFRLLTFIFLSFRSLNVAPYAPRKFLHFSLLLGTRQHGADKIYYV